MDTPPEIGDEVTYTPNNPKYEDEVTGFVAEKIKGTADDTGYEVLVNDEFGQRAIRLWTSRGTFTKTGKTADWAKPTPKPEPKYSAPAPQGKPYKNAGDLATEYKRQGLSRQRAWDQFVIDTILTPRYRSEQLDAKDFYKLYNAS